MAENTQGSDSPAQINVPDRPALEGLEDKLSERWAQQKTYAFDENRRANRSIRLIHHRRPHPARSMWGTCSPTLKPTLSPATSV